MFPERDETVIYRSSAAPGRTFAARYVAATHSIVEEVQIAMSSVTVFDFPGPLRALSWAMPDAGALSSRAAGT